MRDSIKISIAIVFILLGVTGCSGKTYRFAEIDLDPEKYEILGEGEETATGIMLFGFIPIQHNDKIARAMEKIKEPFGGDDLVNITIKESWFWAYILNGYKVHVSATVVKNKQDSAGYVGEETTEPKKSDSIDIELFPVPE